MIYFKFDNPITILIHSAMVKSGRLCRKLSFVFLLTMLSLAGAPAGSAADLVSQTLCDLQVLYLFEEPTEIDWSTLYYLKEKSACHVDLLTVSSGAVFHLETREVPDRGLSLYQYFTGTDSLSFADSVIAVQFATRRPDIIIIGTANPGPRLTSLIDRLRSLPGTTASIFDIRKIYRLSPLDVQDSVPSSSVAINTAEMHARYCEAMKLEIPQLFPWMHIADKGKVRLMRYELLWRSAEVSGPDPDFISGLEPLRLVPLLGSVLDEGAVKRSFLVRACSTISLLNMAQQSVGARRVDDIIAAYKQIVILQEQTRSEIMLTDLPDFSAYMQYLIDRTRRAVLQEIGVDWDGEIILRDSPHGPKLKFRASLSVNGPKSVELSYVRFQPYWDSVAVVLDSVSRKIAPHQSFVREYLVDIDRGYLEARMPESLVFRVDMVYGTIPLTVSSALPIWETPDLSVSFEPDFFFVPPHARVEVDRVVSFMNLKAVISKPLYYSGTVSLNLVTPRGVFAGAYRQTWQLEKGRSSETVRIPFSVSNLFELGIHKQTLSLSVDNRMVATDTGIIRIAACDIADTINVGLMSDTTGLLEDILRMSQAVYWPLTDRSLQTGDLDAYDVIIIGPGALRDYPSFKTVKGRLEEYLRYGGSLVVLGQPSDWPEGSLPLSFVPTMERVEAADLLNRIPEAKVMHSPYVISETNLLDWLAHPREISAAVVSPAEKVFVTPSGAALLSVSRLGEGQVIFCGLPIIDMIADLNIEAIHLLANLLNY